MPKLDLDSIVKILKSSYNDFTFEFCAMSQCHDTLNLKFYLIHL